MTFLEEKNVFAKHCDLEEGPVALETDSLHMLTPMSMT